VASTAEYTLEVVIIKGLLVIVTAVLARAALAAALVTVMVIGVGKPLIGALNRPAEEMLPPLADHVTAVLLVLLTTTVN
jgi:hypothetical protein